MPSPDPTLATSAAQQRRWTIRRAAAALCGLIATIYVLIGLEVITVVEEAVAETEEAVDMVVFGLGAASIFVVGAVLLLTVDRRRVWFAGAALQVMIIAMYVSVAADRTPAFEAWGIALRVMQLVLLAALVHLAIRRPGDQVPEPVATGDDRTLAA